MAKFRYVKSQPMARLIKGFWWSCIGKADKLIDRWLKNDSACISSKLEMWLPYQRTKKNALISLLTSELELTQYLLNTKKKQHYFCKHCGWHCFGVGTETPIGKMYGVNLGGLTDVTDEELQKSLSRLYTHSKAPQSFTTTYEHRANIFLYVQYLCIKNC